MKKPLSYITSSFVIMTSLGLGSCGWVEVPADGVSSSPTPKASPTTTVSKRGLSTSAPPQQRQVDIPGTVLVQKGDTVYAISRRYNASVRDIIEENDLSAPFHLNVGQRLKLPSGPVYTVQKGDTLYSVSRAHGTDVYTLARFNNIGAPYILTPGQQLKLPFGAQAQKPAQSQPETVKKAPPQPTTLAKAKPRLSKTAIPKPPPRSGSGFSWPVEGKVISNFGPKKDGLHNDGINIAVPRGTPVKAAQNGVVAYRGNELRGFGNMLLIKHDGGWITAYAHLDQLSVERGQKVRKGELIGKAGSTGSVSTPQLHFEVRKGMNPRDPKKYLR